MGGFTHNVFHTSWNGGSSGSILGWFDLDTNETNTYDPVTGALSAHFNIFSDSSHTTTIGTVFANGNLPAANFQGDGGLAGSIDWQFNFSIDNILQDYLNGQTLVTLNYLDQIYTTTSLGTDVNSWTSPYLSLWGSGALSDDNFCDSDDCYQQRLPYLGSDVVIQTAHMPEPMSMVLMASGLVGAFGIQRRKRS